MPGEDCHKLHVARNPSPGERQAAEAQLSLASVEGQAAAEIEARAAELVALGLKPADALHVACAEAAGRAALVTCDDRLIARGQWAGLHAMTPTEFVSMQEEAEL